MSRILPVTERMPAWRANGVLFPFSELFRRARKFALGAFVLAAAAVIVGIDSLAIHPALAQRIEQRNPNAQLLLKADQLIYDNDAQVVTAIGDVQLDYDGFNVVAERVSYNQRTRRVTASGNVEIIEPDGNRIYADSIDLTILVMVLSTHYGSRHPTIRDLQPKALNVFPAKRPCSTMVCIPPVNLVGTIPAKHRSGRSRPAR